MQAVKTILLSIVKWVTDFLLSVIASLARISFLGEKGALILVYALFGLTIVSLLAMGVLFFTRKKYSLSISILVTLVLLLGYLATLAYNIGHKAD